ncbi:MAG TPA: hypothetical protein VNY51_09165 [Candidatus Dormibacteraeota bacterium]|jgi:hypothetical protein|nr:hypothetical protein [Candidatus Dormibacteraeota bacterium]
MKRPIVIYSLSAVAAVAIATYIRVRMSAAYQQRPDQVVFREPGQRRLGTPRDAAPEAREDLDFALLSQAAYQRTADAKAIEAGESLDPDGTLESMGWSRWKDFPSGVVKQKVEDAHLRVEVWSNPSSNKVAVAFGGTVARNIKDWQSDLRWFIHYKTDEYTVIVETFGRAFVEEYVRQWAFLKSATLFSTGHSLGGGLAHEFAYSLPRADISRVNKVFAFDPSPVTGYYSVEKSLRTENSKDLLIDRIYERGEILAYFRSMTNFVYPPSAKQPQIRQVRYNMFYTHNPFAGHSMAAFAMKLYGIVKSKPMQ